MPLCLCRLFKNAAEEDKDFLAPQDGRAGEHRAAAPVRKVRYLSGGERGGGSGGSAVGLLSRFFCVPESDVTVRGGLHSFFPLRGPLTPLTARAPRPKVPFRPTEEALGRQIISALPLMILRTEKKRDGERERERGREGEG